MILREGTRKRERAETKEGERKVEGRSAIKHFFSTPFLPPFPHPDSPPKTKKTSTLGDGAPVVIGDDTNIQDGATVRTTPEDIGTAPSSSSGRSNAPTTLGARVTVGHNASIGAGVSVGDEALIGMGASLGDGAVVESGAMVAAGAAVSAGSVVPSGELWGGVPAKRLRALRPEEAAFLPVSASKYAELAAGYAKEGLGA